MTRFVFIGLLFLTACATQRTANPPTPTMQSSDFDWQGHRGARGLLPENSIPAFLHALTYPAVRTLELDVVVTADGQVVVSHEPWMSATICSHSDGRAVTEAEAPQLNIYKMTLAEVQAFDCGLRDHPRFPDQLATATIKPTLEAVIRAADAEAVRLQRALPAYNIEIKSAPEWDAHFTPPPAAFAQRVMDVIAAAGIAARTTVQSFDIRSLQAVRAIAPTQTLAYLIESNANWEENLARLGFDPQIYSPFFALVTPQLVAGLHARGIQIIPWTVNETADMIRLQAMGVDGIITDYPNRIPH